MPLIDLGKPFSLGFNDISDSRWNAKTWNIDTGANLFSMPEKIPGQFMLPTADGDGFFKNSPCFRSVDDADTIIPIGNTAHLHNDFTAEAGGFLPDILLANLGYVHTYWGQTYTINDFYQESNGTGAGITTVIASNIANIELDTGTATNGWAGIRRFGLPLRMSNPSMFIIRHDIDGTLTNYNLKFGVHPERIDGSNTAENKYGIEACSGQTNYQCFSADGTARSTTPSAVAVNGSDNVWLAQHFPTDEEIIYVFDSDPDTTVTKITDIPVSGGSTSSRMFMVGIQSTTSSAAKRLSVRGFAITGTPDTSDWTFP